MNLLEFLSRPWPWYVAGPLITVTMATLLLIGRRFGVSSTFRTACAIGGAGGRCEFFRFDWRKETWNFIFLAGTILGGAIAALWLRNPEPIALNPRTVADLAELGIPDAGATFLPERIFSWGALASPEGLIMLLGGGFLVGFGARWADGCTSGHAISGLSNLQWPSLVAVIGFFAGGLLTTHVLLPLILG